MSNTRSGFVSGGRSIWIATAQTGARPLRLWDSLLWIAVALVCVGCARQSVTDSRPEEADRITVATYNVLGGRNTDGSRDIGRIAEVIRRLDADVIALQEVDRMTNRLEGIDLAAELSRRTGLQQIFGAAMDYDGGQYGVAVLTRLEILRTENHALPHAEGSEPRTALVAFLRTRRDLPFLFISTHLDHQEHPHDRRAQSTRLAEILRAHTGMDGILAGDLNATPGSESISPITMEWIDTWGDAPGGFTYPSDDPDRRIDYVLVSPESRWEVIDAHTADTLWPDDPDWQQLLRVASDHLPIVAVLRSKGEKQ